MNTGIQSWKNLVRFIGYFFSIPQLLKTLFVPWHRDTFESESSSAVERFVQKIAFSIISRVLAFIIRIATIILGLLAYLGCVIIFPIFALIPIKFSYRNLVQMGSIGKSWSYPLTPFLDRHARQLREAPKNYIPESRHELYQDLERILTRTSERNVLLLGNSGIGKSTLLEQFAKEMHWGLLDERLNFKRMVQLQMDSMSKEEFQRAIDEAAGAGNIIAVIEDAHRYPITPELMPYLEHNKFQVILTSTMTAYHDQWKHDQDAMRHLEAIEMEEPTAQETKELLGRYALGMGLQTKNIPEEALEEIVTYTNKLMLHEPQPAKSLEILDELVNSGQVLSTENVDNLISRKTNVPLGTLEQDESKMLLSLEEDIKNNVIGQEEAIHEISEALKRARAGVNNPDRPIGVFMFLGPTGVGKTYTAQMLAKNYFGSKDAMIRFDMSEFQEEQSSENFMDRAANAIEEQPFSLVFFDEFEKAHHDLLNIFLQIFDEGRLTTNNGREVSFDNAIIICTSNAGSELLHDNPNIEKDDLINNIIENNTFKPELINRFDAVTIFHTLTQEQVKQVTRLMLENLNERMQEEKGVRFEITEQLVEQVANEGYDPQFGARPIRRAMQELVENQLANKILEGKAQKGSKVTIDLNA